MMTDIEQSVVDSMVEYFRDMAKRNPLSMSYSPYDWHARGLEIAALLPPPVDPDLVTAREIVAQYWDRQGSRVFADRTRMGTDDAAIGVVCAIAALRRAREEGVKS